jgi:23S rRNA (adenine2030-N6)-methyltransferase
MLIDPPFERGDEAQRIIDVAGQALSVRPDAVLAIWAPLKDLESFDALLRGVERLGAASVIAAEARLRPLVNPMKMNGCALLFLGAPFMEEPARAICAGALSVFGEDGASARVYRA